MKNWSFVFVTLLVFACPALPATAQFPGKQSEFHSFDRFDFLKNDRKCIIIAPKSPKEGKPWIWRARFFGHEPQLDIAMLELGYHIAYIDVAGLFGSPVAVEIWNDFHSYLTDEHEFHPKPVLEGMSRGGLIIFNWAKENPDKVSCIYGDAPVCDIKSWPGGKGRGKGAPSAWKQCLEAYRLTEAQAMDESVAAARCNPIDGLEKMASHRVPILCIVGDADDVVPVNENTAILERRYQQLGGPISVIHKPGVGHHPHSLKDPTPIIKFITKSTSAN